MSMLLRPFGLGLTLLIVGGVMILAHLAAVGGSLAAAVAPVISAGVVAVPTWLGRARWRKAHPGTLTALVAVGLGVALLAGLIGLSAGGPAFLGFALYLGGGAMIAGLIFPALLSPRHV